VNFCHGPPSPPIGQTRLDRSAGGRPAGEPTVHRPRRRRRQTSGRTAAQARSPFGVARVCRAPTLLVSGAPASVQRSASGHARSGMHRCHMINPSLCAPSTSSGPYGRNPWGWRNPDQRHSGSPSAQVALSGHNDALVDGDRRVLPNSFDPALTNPRARSQRSGTPEAPAPHASTGTPAAQNRRHRTTDPFSSPARRSDLRMRTLTRE
jgi:hypothetical protein